MSGIYIPRMQKPTRCGDCPFVMEEDVNWCGRCNYNICDGLVDLNEVPEWCDLFPVPDHGRLIEAEPLVNFIVDGLNSGEFGYDQIKVLTEIQFAPTIIQKDGEKK